MISAAVARKATVDIKFSGNHGFRFLVETRKFSQFPQADRFFGHSPNLSATADSKPIPMPNRKYSFKNFISMQICGAKVYNVTVLPLVTRSNIIK